MAIISLKTYAAVSTTLAAGVIVKALHERPNFYSASVYLAQSNACLMILTNVVLLCVYGFMSTLQNLLFGPLRRIEREQLYERGWMALTETCLAMATFREDIGGWFLFMCVGLLIGRIWRWMTESRVDYLEQQPPADPRLYHIRLATSLLISLVYDVAVLRYCINTVVQENKPSMMVMFGFEFAVLTVGSTSTALRYLIFLQEQRVIQQQLQARREERLREREESSAADGVERPDGMDNVADDDDEIDPVWEEKGRWVFALDLATEFFKLIIYLAFFVILLMFHGIPIHIIRDVAMTTSNFVKKIVDYIKYRQATRDMNTRYPDATAEELAAADTCIICREEMRPWTDQDQGGRRPRRNERVKPKKLPCGHILHFGCLRSWLERQQACPICREPVLALGLIPVTAGDVNARRRQEEHARNNRARAPPPAPPRLRTYRLGPLRLVLGTAPANGVGNIVRQLENGDNVDTRANGPAAAQNLEALISETNQRPTQVQLRLIEQRINQEIAALNLTRQQLATVQHLQGELERLRQVAQSVSGSAQQGVGLPPPPIHIPSTATPIHSTPPLTPLPQPGTALPSGHEYTQANVSAAVPGLTIPEGWSLIPLHRLPQQPSAGYPNMATGFRSSSPAPNFTHTHLAGPSNLSRTASPHRQPSQSSLRGPTPANLQNQVRSALAAFQEQHATSSLPPSSVSQAQGSPQAAEADTVPTLTVPSSTGDNSGTTEILNRGSSQTQPEANQTDEQPRRQPAQPLPTPTQPQVPRSGTSTPQPEPTPTVRAPVPASNVSGPAPPTVPQSVPRWNFDTAMRRVGTPPGYRGRSPAPPMPPPQLAAPAPPTMGESGGSAVTGADEPANGSAEADKGKGKVASVEDADDE